MGMNLASEWGMHLPYSFGRYVMSQKIAQGGMAEIFKGKFVGESGFTKEVAIKRLLPIWSDNPNFINMLIDEAKALVHLNHPNIVQIFDLGRDEKTFYISMEWVDGIDLRQFFLKGLEAERECPLSLTLFIVSEVLKALDYAHHKIHLVHRDVSPQNILLSYEGQVKLTDFGIAKGNHRSQETTQAQVKGKYTYMSPEQARGEVIDCRTDLYALGIIFYELLEGKRLFDGVNDLATLEQVREARLPKGALQKWPAVLRGIVLKALQKETQYRYQTAAEFLKDLQKFIEKQNLRTASSELASYLSEISPKNEDKVDVEATVSNRADAKKKSFSAPLLFGTLFFFLVSLGGGFLWRSSAKKTPKQNNVSVAEKIAIPPLKGSITIDSKPKSFRGHLSFGGMEKDFETPFHWTDLDVEEEKEGEIKILSDKGKEVIEKFSLGPLNPNWAKTVVVEEPKPGSLKVAAKPWGQVSIPGVVRDRETPLNTVYLEPGEYRVQVAYPPANQKTEKVIQIASGADIICQADFSAKPTLVCR